MRKEKVILYPEMRKAIKELLKFYEGCVSRKYNVNDKHRFFLSYYMSCPLCNAMSIIREKYEYVFCDQVCPWFLFTKNGCGGDTQYPNTFHTKAIQTKLIKQRISTLRYWYRNSVDKQV